MRSTISKWIRQLASTFVILLLLAATLFFYYLKYIPDKRSEFNRSAFLELNQMKDAFLNRNQGYRDAIANIIHQEKLDTKALANFNYRGGKGNIIKGNRIGLTEIELDDTNRSWQMEFPVYLNEAPTFSLSKNIDTLMSELVSTYKDIFDGYLLIRCGGASRGKEPDSTENSLVVLPGLLVNTSPRRSKSENDNHNGEIIYKSGDLTMDYQVNSDSLLKKSNGFNLLNLMDVTVEGNPYKLFLSPFKIADQRLVIAGLISQPHYAEAYKKIPFNFFALFVVLFLLLVIHLPILKVYILGVNERIRDWDIRMIIGSYFIAAFFGFFLLSTIFLDREQSLQNRTNLRLLSNQIEGNLTSELVDMSNQLSVFDSTLNSICSSNTDSLLRAMVTDTIQQSRKYLDQAFKPRIYPYLENVFWIDSSGKWTARWAFKEVFKKSPLIVVKDRQYFRDFKLNEPFSVPGVKDSITIQPTLSKLEGEYVVTVVKKSQVGLCFPRNIQSRIRPYLIGMSSEMHSVSNVIMPPGYGFSIVDNQGAILYDSKRGRPLLSNIFTQTENPDALRQTTLYRTWRNFDKIPLRGKSMALISRPLTGMPYQLIVYYNLTRSEELEEHLVGLSALLIGIVLLLLIFSAFVNQWSKRQPRLLQSRSQHFEWLHPSAHPSKQKYYVHLIEWMIRLLASYALAWGIIEQFFHTSEFSLFYISLLFPFYISIHYYEIRERYYDSQVNRSGIITYLAHPSPALRGLMLFIIICINCLTSVGEFRKEIAWPVLIMQLAWIAVIFWSSFVIKKTLPHPKNAEITPNTEDQFTTKIIRPYVLAILTGVSLISIVPAFGIFWLLFRHETSLDLNSERLTTAKQIDLRRNSINSRISQYNYTLHDEQDLSALNALKFSHGIYLVSETSKNDNSPTLYSPLIFPSPNYISLHQLFFPQDSLVLSWANQRDSAWDGSWYFGYSDGRTTGDNRDLIFTNQGDETNKNPFRLTGDTSLSWNASILLAHSLKKPGILIPLLYIVSLCCSLLLAYFLTVSLTRRIFLLDLKRDYRPEPKHITEAETAFTEYFRDDTRRGSPVIAATLKDLYLSEKNLDLESFELKVLSNLTALEGFYDQLWFFLPSHQKFILYDFAQDGFSNYKSEKDLLELVTKGLLFFDDLRLTTVTLSFQEYILSQKDESISEYISIAANSDTWKKFKTPLLIVLAGVGVFIFFTQDAIYQKLTGLLTSLTSLLPMLRDLFSGKND
jgi:hypothetical protein